MTPHSSVAVLSIPYDAGNGVASGAREAPARLVAGGEVVGDPFVSHRVVSLDHGGGEAMQRLVGREVASLAGSGSFLLTLGGDHSISLPVIDTLARRRPLSILWLDAHTDFDAARTGSLTHKNVLRRIVALPDVERVVVAGYRGYTAGDERRMGEPKLTVLPSRELRRFGSAWMMEHLPAAAAWYVSVDIDVLDPVEAPATPTPVPSGLRWGELRNLVDAVLTQRQVVGLDLVEVAPNLDVADRTVQLARSLLLFIIQRHHAARLETIGPAAGLSSASEAPSQ